MQRLGLHATRGCSAYRRRIVSLHAFIGKAVRHRAFATSHPQCSSPDPDEGLNIRWFKQDSPGSSQRRQINPEEEDFFDSEESQLLRERIQELEGELRELRGERKGPSGEETSLIEPLLDQLSDEDRQKVRIALRETKLNDEDLRDIEKESTALIERVFPDERGASDNTRFMIPEGEGLPAELTVSPDQKAHIKRLNSCLENVVANPSDKKSRKNLWVSYERLKRLVPSCLQAIPDKAWHILWDSQTRSSAELRERSSHLSVLSQDMLRSGKALSQNQQRTVIELFILEGRLDEALSLWGNVQSQLNQHTEDGKAHTLLGIRLLAARGNPQRAQEIAMDLLREGNPEDSPILVPIIEAWVSLGTDQDIKSAWALYLEFRKHLGAEIKIQDYDAVVMCFINARRTDIALAVFKDMMLSGQQTSHESRELYKTSLSLVGSMQSKSMNTRDITNVSLTALMTLPKQFQNKFFYGSWIKKLIGMREIDAAASVTELMYERGVKPDPKHLNGIIGAWLRDGSVSNKAKAEQLGWAMIQERLDFVKQRSTTSVSASLRTKKHELRDIPKYLQRKVPAASIETFSLLLLHYERRGNSSMVALLKEQLRLAEIPPNSYFMNHLLYGELRKGNLRAAWDIYYSMNASTSPDLETFACLWDCEKKHLGRPPTNNSDTFPGPRHLFAEMVAWYFSQTRFNRKAFGQEFSGHLYNQIMRCMCLAMDIEGALVALHALKALFTFCPDDDTLRMVPMQVSRMMSKPSKTVSRRQRLGRSNPVSQRRLTNLSHMLDLIIDQRVKKLEGKGVKLEECDKGRLQDEQLYILSELLRGLLRQTVPDEAILKANLKTATMDMGVSRILRLDFLLADE
ncbi:MAG: hypothetical protein LQ342_005588 [Letrouitia transgressa]|nr:MAG: hypothetical protein LQ342_005588 [Letrouitia transgressa]